MFLFLLDVFAALKLNAAGIIFLSLLESVHLHLVGDFLDNDFKGW
jgi:hypothetical protein